MMRHGKASPTTHARFARTVSQRPDTLIASFSQGPAVVELRRVDRQGHGTSSRLTSILPEDPRLRQRHASQRVVRNDARPVVQAGREAGTSHTYREARRRPLGSRTGDPLLPSARRTPRRVPSRRRPSAQHRAIGRWRGRSPWAVALPKMSSVTIQSFKLRPARSDDGVRPPQGMRRLAHSLAIGLSGAREHPSQGPGGFAHDCSSGHSSRRSGRPAAR